MDAITARAIAARTPELSALQLQSLVAEFGTLDAAFDAGIGESKTELSAAARAYLAAPDQALLDTDLRWLERSGTLLLDCTATHYPPLLKEIHSPPPVLYVQGNVAALSTPQLAMVGSRNPTPHGKETAREFAQCFAQSGLTITSGLALGIDAASHEGALKANGFTLAVCGCGLDRIYPKQHEALADRIRAHGALLSEFPPGTPPLRHLFPQRNRLISGLSLGTLVVEAAVRSGSLITARFAAEQGRDVFAIPGSIHNPLARGCHRLIRDGATLVETAVEVLLELKISLVNQQVSLNLNPLEDRAALDKEYKMLLDALAFEPSSVDCLAQRSGLSGESIASMLLILELDGRVVPYPGGRYARVVRNDNG
jgi:DNA processing protein